MGAACDLPQACGEFIMASAENARFSHVRIPRCLGIEVAAMSPGRVGRLKTNSYKFLLKITRGSDLVRRPTGSGERKAVGQLMNSGRNEKAVT